MNADCRRIAELLPDSRWLGDAERRALDTHLAQCAACREEARLLQELGEAFAELETASPPADFADGVLDAVRRERAAAEPRHSVIPVLLGILVAQVAGVLLLRQDVAAVTHAAWAWGREWYAGWLVTLGDSFAASAREVASAVPTPSLPFQVPWALVAGGVAMVLVFTVITLHQTRQQHAR